MFQPSFAVIPPKDLVRVQVQGNVATDSAAHSPGVGRVGLAHGGGIGGVVPGAGGFAGGVVMPPLDDQDAVVLLEADGAACGGIGVGVGGGGIGRCRRWMLWLRSLFGRCALCWTRHLGGIGYACSMRSST